MKYFITIVFSLVISHMTLAQQDTLLLEELNIVAPRLAPYMYGAKVISISGLNTTGNLNEAIAANSATYFKDYGNGQLSTISFRGTSASHTSVLWNGIDINSPTLGSTDFSLIPSYLLDDVAIQFGGSSALYGSGAIGGVVSLDRSRALFQNAHKTNVHSEFGSFGHRVIAMKSKVSTEKFESQTGVYSKTLTNDFAFDLRGVSSQQNNAGVDQIGISQQLSFPIKSGQWLEFDGLYLNNHREIQPPTTNPNAEDQLIDDNIYLSLVYYNESGSGLWTVKGNFLKTVQHYNSTSVTNSNQWGLTTDYDIAFNQSTALKFGVKAVRVSADNSTNLAGISENRVDAFVSFSHLPKPWWKLSANLRQSFYSSETAPISPSIGQEIELINKEGKSITLKSSISRSYRIPTLNDRFWFPGGNPNLLSEDGLNIEQGAIWEIKGNGKNFKLEATRYYTYAKNWIVWLPVSNNIWSPTNLRDVNVKGWEMGINWSKKWSSSHIELAAHYNIVRSINKRGLSATDPTGKGNQLPYTPRHAATGQVIFGLGNWTFNILTDYTDLRYSTLDNSDFNSVKAYFISNFKIDKEWRIGNTIIKSAIRCNNITNTDYQNLKNYAMPGRNYTIEININI